MSAFDEPGLSDNEDLPKTHPILKWDCSATQSIPEASMIRRIHIYDFDNTLFKSPLPNKKLWDKKSIDILVRARYINNTSWWQNPDFLREAGSGYEVEKKKAWSGLWITHILKEAKKSCDEPGTLTILVTGRKETYFKDIILDMLSSQGLEFSCVILKKGSQRNTAKYKQDVFQDFIVAYPRINELVLYEDRPEQLRAFHAFFKRSRRSFRYNLIKVAPKTSELREHTELELVRHWIASHNHNSEAHKVSLGPMQVIEDPNTSIYKIE